MAASFVVVSSAAAAPEDAVMNKEGFWSIDVDDGSCAASMTLQGGAVLLLRGDRGEVSAALFSRTALPKGKTLGLVADDQAIEVPAAFGEGRTVVYYDGVFDAASLSRLRGARQLRILIDGRPVAAMTLEGTGFPGAIDGVAACSKGESGWWGNGVDLAAADGPVSDSDIVYNKEDAWALIPIGSKEGGCLAQAVIEADGRLLQFLQKGDFVTIAVASTGKALRRGRKGLLEFGGERFDFVPAYDGRSYMMVDGDLAGEPLTALRAARDLTVRVDGKPLAEVNLEGTGFPLILDELAACARGEPGWWTANAKVSGG